MTAREELDAFLAHPDVARLTRALAERPGVAEVPDPGARLAAVALILRAGEAGEPELLFIRRAEHPADPWSGHVAFPGGRKDPTDATLEATAERETLEETGIDLARDGVVLGRLDDLQPRTPTLPPIVVRPFVAAVLPLVSLTLSDECADAFWVPLAWLRDPTSRLESVVRVRGADMRVPSYRRGEHVIWGMTERILQQFLGYLAVADTL